MILSGLKMILKLKIDLQNEKFKADAICISGNLYFRLCCFVNCFIPIIWFVFCIPNPEGSLVFPNIVLRHMHNSWFRQKFNRLEHHIIVSVKSTINLPPRLETQTSVSMTQSRSKNLMGVTPVVGRSGATVETSRLLVVSLRLPVSGGWQLTPINKLSLTFQ